MARASAAEIRELLASARRARKNAYAPYSRFLVGAAVLDERGRIHAGCNVENASYGLSVCAERNAVAAAVLTGARKLRAVAIVTSRRHATPCGACRQVLVELSQPSTAVYTAGPSGAARRATLAALLPDAFRL